MRQLSLRDMTVILCAYLQNCVLTHTWAGPGHSGTSCWSYLCVHISRALRGQRRPFNWDLKNLVSVKKILINLRKILGLLHPIALFPSNLQKWNMNRTESSWLHMKCSPLQFRKMELFLMLNNYSSEFISPFILHPVLISPEQKRKPNPKQTNK